MAREIAKSEKHPEASVYKQTTFRTVDAIVEDNISQPYVIIHAVRICFRKLKFYAFLDGLKEKDIRSSSSCQVPAERRQLC